METEHPEIQETPDTPEEQSPAPAPAPDVSEKRGRGRPPGAKNKVKIVVKPVEIPEPKPEPSKPVVTSTPRAKPVRMQRETPEIDPDVMHSTIMRYAFEHAARSSHDVRAQRASKFDVMLSRMVR